MSAVAVEHARQQWRDGYRRLGDLAADRALHERLLAQVDVALAELNRRVGQTFSLAELTDAYRDADRWLLEALEHGPGVTNLALVEDAAFHLYSRGAVDYAP
jgi:hypothetical protein